MKHKIDWNLPVKLPKPTSDLYSKIEVDTWDDDDKVVEVLFYHKNNEKYHDLICFDFDSGRPISGAYNSLLFQLVNCG